MILDGKEYTVKLNGKVFHCALDITMHYIGGKWKCIILWYLKGGAMRFSVLKRQMPDISEKMLSQQLKELEKEGILERKVFAEVPPRVEYSVTAFGKKLLPIVDAMGEWGREIGKKKGEIIIKELKPKAAKKTAGEKKSIQKSPLRK